jgi:hypothetical protein
MFKESSTSPYSSLSCLKCVFHCHVEWYLALLLSFIQCSKETTTCPPSFVTNFRRIDHRSLSIALFIKNTPLGPIFHYIFRRNRHWSLSSDTKFRRNRHVQKIRYWPLCFTVMFRNPATGPYPLSFLYKSATGPFISLHIQKKPSLIPILRYHV